MKVVVYNGDNTPNKILDTKSEDEVIGVVKSILKLANTVPQIQEVRCVFDTKDENISVASLNTNNTADKKSYGYYTDDLADCCERDFEV